MTGLIEGQWYAYRVRAVNRLGASRPCKATDEILAVDPKGKLLYNSECLDTFFMLTKNSILLRQNLQLFT